MILPDIMEICCAAIRLLLISRARFRLRSAFISEVKEECDVKMEPGSRRGVSRQRACASSRVKDRVLSGLGISWKDHYVVM